MGLVVDGRCTELVVNREIGLLDDRSYRMLIRGYFLYEYSNFQGMGKRVERISSAF